MVMVSAEGALGKWLGHEGGALVKEICSLIKEIPETSLTPSTEECPPQTQDLLAP